MRAAATALGLATLLTGTMAVADVYTTPQPHQGMNTTVVQGHDGDHLWVDSTLAKPAPLPYDPTPYVTNPLRAPWSVRSVPCHDDTDPQSDDVIVDQALGNAYQYYTSVPKPSPYKGGADPNCMVSVPTTPYTYVE